MLIDALTARMPESEVWKALLRRAVTTEQMQEWKRKCLYYMGKAKFLQGEFTDAKVSLELAIKLTPPNDKALVELKDLFVKSKEKIAEENKKAKSTWGKAFKKNSVVAEADPPSPGSPTVVDSANSPSTASSSSSSPAPNGDPKQWKKVNKKKKTESDSSDKQSGKNNNQLSTFLFSPFTVTALLLGLSGCAAYFLMRGRKIR